MAKTQLPDPPVAEKEPGSSKAALAALDTADQAPATPSETTAPTTDEKKDGDRSEGSSPGAGEKRGPGRPVGATKRIKGDEYAALKKEQLMGVAAEQARQIAELNGKLADVHAGTAITRLADQQIIDESVTEACAATVDILAAGASQLLELDISIKPSDKEKLAALWARVAKLQLGENAKHSPIAAAVLATVSIGWDAYLDAKLDAKFRRAEPQVVS